MNKLFFAIATLAILTSCKSINYSEVRNSAMTGNVPDIARMQAAYLQISPSSRLNYMLDLAALQRKHPEAFQSALAQQKPQTQQAVGYLLQGEKQHRDFLEKILRPHGSNNSP
jgi:hypothetical protein